jgi:hypothetical protein
VIPKITNWSAARAPLLAGFLRFLVAVAIVGDLLVSR